jgi:hypothetical protein
MEKYRIIRKLNGYDIIGSYVKVLSPKMVVPDGYVFLRYNDEYAEYVLESELIIFRKLFGVKE